MALVIPPEYRPAGLTEPPAYIPVTYDNIETDEFYVVRMTGMSPSFTLRDMMVFVDTKNAEQIRAFLFAIRPIDRVFDMEKLLESGLVVPNGEQLVAGEDGGVPRHVSDVEEHADETVTRAQFRNYMNHHPRANEVFNQLPLRAGAWEPQAPLTIDEDGTVSDGSILRYPYGREFVHEQFDPTTYGYVFYAPAPPAAGAAAEEAAPAEPIEGGGRRRRTTRKRTTRRRRAATRRRATRRRR